MTSPLPKSIISILAAAAVAGGSAQAARADSIAYIKGGDVWLTTTDAARQFQVTGTGGYVGVAQADDGTILATTDDNSLERLDRYGAVESSIRTPVSQSLNGSSTVFEGPYDADISPDGKTVGYSFMKFGLYQYPDGTRDADQYDGHGFTRSDALTGFLDQGYKYARDWTAPEFLDNSTVLVSNGPGYPSTPFALEKVGSGDPKSWFADGDNMHPMDATISRNRRFIAAVHGTDRLSMSVYRIGDGPIETATINKCFTYSDTDPVSYNSPTFNAAGTVLAWGNGHGLYIAPVGDGATTCPDGQGGADVIPGASQPDWGPADIPAARPADHPLPTNGGPSGGGHTTQTPVQTTTVTPAPGAGTSGAGITGAGNGGTTAGAQLAVHVPAAKLAAALRKGLTVTVTAPAAGRVTVVARNGKAKAGSGAATAKAGKPVAVKVTFGKAVQRTLRHARKVTLTLTIAQGDATRSTKVTLKR